MENIDIARKDALKVQALTQRIATVVANYESELADFRAQATLQIEGLTNDINSMSRQVAELEGQLQELKDALSEAEED